jgi:ubiquinone/menaquinone biosynthesis C-methylase UbiE
MGRVYDATWGRLFSAVYDSCMKGTDDAGLREMRRELLSQARGSVLEIGAGTGLNLDLYPEAVESLTLTEPDPHMTKQLRKKLAESNRQVEVIEAPAEKLPFDDDTFDTAVVTLVLCTVPDQAAALKEIRRILKPDGRFLFLEHVRSRNPGLAKWQDRLERPWRFLGDGCHCNRDTVSAISTAGFELSDVQRDSLPKAPPIVRPLAMGNARSEI